jgi:hypothetical protein
MDRKRRRLLPMKWTQSDVVRPRLAQLDVVADHADDVRLLLHRISEIARISH